MSSALTSLIPNSRSKNPEISAPRQINASEGSSHEKISSPISVGIWARRFRAPEIEADGYLGISVGPAYCDPYPVYYGRYYPRYYRQYYYYDNPYEYGYWHRHRHWHHHDDDDD